MLQPSPRTNDIIFAAWLSICILHTSYFIKSVGCNHIICVCRSRETARCCTPSWKHSRPDCIFNKAPKRIVFRVSRGCTATTPSLKVGARSTWVKIRYRNLRARSFCVSLITRERAIFRYLTSLAPFQPCSMQMQHFCALTAIQNWFRTVS